MRIAVLGSGYVGLVSGACLADFGHFVTCVDLDADRIRQLQAGEIPIFEPGLETLVTANASAGRLVFSSAIETAIAEAEVVFIAVGTPSRHGDGHADLSQVYCAAEMIGTAIADDTVIVVKSTVPVGTGDEVERIIASISPGANFAVVSNPEFLREGTAIEDFKRPDRIVIGVEDARAREVMTEVYHPLILNASPLLYVSRRTAELTKYASNAFLALKVTFINEVADLCEAIGANIEDVARGIGLDSRIGAKFLNAGPGYGGSCFPKDTMALVKTARDYDSPLSLVETMVSANENRKQAMVRKIVGACGGSVRGKTIAVLGLTFKPDTDDVRGAPAMTIIDALRERGARIVAYDPQGMQAAADAIVGLTLGRDAYDAAAGADAVVIVTEWSEFRSLDLERLGAAMTEKVLIDLRNIYSTDQARRHGFAYVSNGRPDGVPDSHMLQAAE